MSGNYYPTPEATIIFDPATQTYGFSFHLPGRDLHYEMNTFTSLDGALAWADPHQERIVWLFPDVRTKLR